MGFASISMTVLGLATTVLVVRRLPPGEFGAYVLLQVGYVFMAEVSSFGLTMAIPKFVAGASDSQYRSDLIKTTISFRFLTVAVLGAIGLIVTPFVGRLSGSSLASELIGYGVLLFGLESLGGAFISILEGLFRFRKLATIKIVSSSSYLVLVAAFVVFMDRGIVGVVQAKAISLVFSYAYAYLAIPREQGSVARFGILKEMLVFGFPLQLQYILDFAYSRIDTLIVGTLLGTAGVAYYEVARKIPQSLSGFYEAFRAVYLPFVANLSGIGDRQKLTAMLNHSIRWLSFLTAAGALVALLFGHEIIVLLFSEEYASSIPAFVLLMIGLNLAFTESTLGYSLIAIDEPDKPLVVNAVRVVISLVSNLLLIPVFGLAGAALASLAGNLAAIPLDVHFLSRRMILTAVRDYLKPILAFGIVAIGFLVLGTSSVPFKIVVVGIYGFTCVLISAITIDDLAAIAKEANLSLLGLRRRAKALGSK